MEKHEGLLDEIEQVKTLIEIFDRALQNLTTPGLDREQQFTATELAYVDSFDFFPKVYEVWDNYSEEPEWTPNYREKPIRRRSNTPFRFEKRFNEHGESTFEEFWKANRTWRGLRHQLNLLSQYYGPGAEIRQKLKEKVNTADDAVEHIFQDTKTYFQFDYAYLVKTKKYLEDRIPFRTLVNQKFQEVELELKALDARIATNEEILLDLSGQLERVGRIFRSDSFLEINFLGLNSVKPTGGRNRNGAIIYFTLIGTAIWILVVVALQNLRRQQGD